MGPYCYAETVRCKMLILVRDIDWGCRCAASFDLDLGLTFDVAIVTLSLKILTRIYLMNHKV